MRLVCQELRLVFRGRRQFRLLLFKRAASLLHFGFLALHFGILLCEQTGLGAQLFVRLLQFRLTTLDFHCELQ